MSKSVLLLVALLGVTMGGCGTTTVAAEDHKNIYEPISRVSIVVNDNVNAIEQPVAEFYHDNVPGGVRRGARNFVSHLKLPTTFVMDIFQGEWRKSGESSLRFLANTTLGVGGVWDVATDWGLPDDKQDCASTLDYYGAPPGNKIVLPILGKTTDRDIVAGVACGFLNPLGYIPNIGMTTYVRTGAGLMDGLDKKHEQSQSPDAPATNPAVTAQADPAYQQIAADSGPLAETPP
jgi:phospholipid-binding lipoprotein MlaA